MKPLIKSNKLTSGDTIAAITLSCFKKYDDFILKILKEFDRADLPVVTNLDFGHTDPMMTLPYGCTMQVDVDSKRISILDNAVN